jgi:hypothetical protein
MIEHQYQLLGLTIVLLATNWLGAAFTWRRKNQRGGQQISSPHQGEQKSLSTDADLKAGIYPFKIRIWGWKMRGSKITRKPLPNGTSLHRESSPARRRD